MGITIMLKYGSQNHNFFLFAVYMRLSVNDIIILSRYITDVQIIEPTFEKMMRCSWKVKL